MRTSQNRLQGFAYYASIICLWLSLVPACSSNTIPMAGSRNDFQPDRQIIPLSGTWKFKQESSGSGHFYQMTTDESEWTDIEVPANWYLEGLDISGVAWYRKHVVIPDEFKGRRVTLKFGGVDYMADVWLNGRHIGFHEGYFQPFAFDVTEAVVFGGNNIIAVKVNSPLEGADVDWSLNKRLIKGIFGHHDTRPGGAWSSRAQEKNTGGIWASVELEIHDVARIDQIRISPQLAIEQKSAIADVAFQVELKQKKKLPVTVRIALRPHNFPSPEGASQQLEWTLAPGVNQLNIPVSIEHPVLWWPWDQGRPKLYSLNITVLEKNNVIDSKNAIFGFREVRYDKNENAWRINGKRMFLRGTNYIPTQWLSEMNEERYRYDIGLMKNANINSVRVHAHIQAEDFYRLSDEAGLLIWQDFPLQWGYADDAAFQTEAVRQAKEMVSLFYNHPAIIAWSLINEPAWEADWMKYRYPTYTKDHNKQLTESLFKAIEPFDTTRHVHAYSATAEHPWLGWYAGNWQDFNKPAPVPIVAEFGAQALPNLPSLRKIFNEDELWPVNDEQWKKWEYHNFQRKETFENAKVAMGATPDEFVQNTQFYQVKLIKLAVESYRRQRYHPVNSLFQFMFVEDWPSINWGIVDYWRVPKLGYYALQQAYQPVLPSIAWQNEHFNAGEAAQFQLWIVNDLLTSFPASKLTYGLRNAATLLEMQTLKINIEADSGRKIKTLEWRNLPPGHYEIVVKAEDQNGSVLGINNHKFTIKQ